jgi:hypothetical protein
VLLAPPPAPPTSQVIPMEEMNLHLTGALGACEVPPRPCLS